jgi:hypothetical protein
MARVLWDGKMAADILEIIRRIKNTVRVLFSGVTEEDIGVVGSKVFSTKRVNTQTWKEKYSQQVGIKASQPLIQWINDKGIFSLICLNCSNLVGNKSRNYAEQCQFIKHDIDNYNNI